MKKVAFYVQIGKKEEIQFGNPLKGGSSVNMFLYDMDNHSDHVTLMYAEMLLVEVDEVVLVIHQHSEAVLGNLTGFFEKLIRNGKSIKAYSIGKTKLPAVLVKKLDVKETTLKELGDILSGTGK